MLVMFIGVSANLAYITSGGEKVNILTVDLAWGFVVVRTALSTIS